jgi:hypothetical protein
MKKLKALILILAILSTTFIAQGSTFAIQTNTIQLTLTPLPAGTSKVDNFGDAKVSTDNAANADWTTTGTEKKVMLWTANVPANLVSAQCADGSGAPKVTKIGVGYEITAAEPNVFNDGNYAYAFVFGTTGQYAFTPGGGGGGEQSDVGTKGGFGSFATPFDLSSFNNSGIGTHMTHDRDGNVSYSVTTKMMAAYIGLSCNIEDGTGGSTDTGSIDDAKEKANTPKTGALEVVAFVTGAALVFVAYEATRMFKKRSNSKASTR